VSCTFLNVATLAGLLEAYKIQLDVAKKALDKKDSAGKKQLDEQGKLLRELNSAINAYQNQYSKSQVGEPLQDYKQALIDKASSTWNSFHTAIRQRLAKTLSHIHRLPSEDQRLMPVVL
jgi:hypothetical protein